MSKLKLKPGIKLKKGVKLREKKNENPRMINGYNKIVNEKIKVS